MIILWGWIGGGIGEFVLKVLGILRVYGSELPVRRDLVKFRRFGICDV